MVERYRATLAYDGTTYNGFQRQANQLPTIQETLENAIFAVTAQRVTVVGAGRTDTGVHASGQVVAFDVEWKHPHESLLKALNANLPPNISLQDIRIQSGFHPRFDAKSRRYVYTVLQVRQRQPLLRQFAWQVYQAIDFSALQTVAEMFKGRHDFGAFGQAPQGENTVREVYQSRWTQHHERYGWRYEYEVEANAFLYHMVRRLVGLQVDVGKGKLTLEQAQQIFQRANISQIKTLAPPQGLILVAVQYNE